MFPLLDLPDFFKMTKKRFEFFLESVIQEPTFFFSVNINEYNLFIGHTILFQRNCLAVA